MTIMSHHSYGGSLVGEVKMELTDSVNEETFVNQELISL